MTEESTTPDLVELVRVIFEAANRRDFDAMLSYFAPDAVLDLSLLGLGHYEGPGAIRGFVGDWIGSYEAYEKPA
jgi:ketosteroid isomerase-like protein